VDSEDEEVEEGVTPPLLPLLPRLLVEMPLALDNRCMDGRALLSADEEPLLEIVVVVTMDDWDIAEVIPAGIEDDEVEIGVGCGFGLVRCTEGVEVEETEAEEEEAFETCVVGLLRGSAPILVLILRC